MDNKPEEETVALPGAGGTEPTILEVLNRNIISGDSGNEPQPQTESSLEKSKNQAPGESVSESTDVTQTDICDSVSIDDNVKQKQGAPQCDEGANDSVDNPNILEIESHLIETLENYSVSEQSDASGVEVKEVPPAKEELSKSSTIETATSPKTVIEIEPSQPKLYKSVKVEVGLPAQEPTVGFTGEWDDKEISLNKEELKQPHIEETVIEDLKSDNSKTIFDESKNAEVSAASDPNFLEKVKPSSEIPTDAPHIEEIIKESSIEDTRECAFGISSASNNDVNQIFETRDCENIVNLEKEHVTKEEPLKKVECDLLDVELVWVQVKNPESGQDQKATSELTSAQPEIIQKNLEDSNREIHETEPFTQSTELFKEPVTPSNEKSLQILTEQISEVVDDSPSNLTHTEEATVEKHKPNSFIATKDNKLIQKDTYLNETVSDDCQNINIDLKLGINGLPISTTKSEQEAKQSFLDSIPQLNESEANSLSTKAKKEYYQSLREYLTIQEERPPIPLQTYRWEDLRRAKQQGAYPWTHLYKRPLGPNEEPEIILLLRKSQEFQHLPSESPKSLKKVRIHDQVLVKETERYISDLSDTENTVEEDTKSVQSETPSVSASESEGKKGRVSKLRGILKRGRSKLAKLDLSPTKSETEPGHTKTVDSPKKSKCCPPIMDKIKIMADKQLKKRQIKKVPLKADEKIVLSEEQKILKLKTSPKAERSEIAHFVEKQDSDEILDIVELEESPSKNRKRREELANEHAVASVLVPDEIIEIPLQLQAEKPGSTEEILQLTPEPTVSEILEEELKSIVPPPKAPRKKKEHVYEDIDNEQLGNKIDEILEEAVVGALKKSLATQDENIKNVLWSRPKLEEMGSSEEDQDKTITRLAPISSIDSASSEEERKLPLSPVAEESEQGSRDDLISEKEKHEVLKITEEHEKEEAIETDEHELKSVLKREPSPNSDKKVTFSHIEDEAEPHREDIQLPEHIKLGENRWSKISDHEYEAIGEPVDIQTPSKPQDKEPSPVTIPIVQVSEPMEVDKDKLPSSLSKQSGDPEESETYPEQVSVQEIQNEIEEHYFSSATTTPRTESRTDYEIHTSQVDSSAIEELPLKPENRKKGFMASAQDKSRKVQANIRSQAGKIRTKLRGMKKPASGSPKAKERKRFKAPEFTKMKLPEMKRPELPKFKTPDMSKLKAPDFKKIEFKRPEFTKFNKPDMSKFKIPERFSSLKLTRSRSLKEPSVSMETTSGTTPESAAAPAKKKFDFTFGTYPRALRKKKDKIANEIVAKADDVPSSETPPSFESATIPRGARDKGPVGSRWVDKFSDVSYGDSESGKYQRYGSEVESLERAERDSSVERRMKEDLSQSIPDEAEIATLETVEQKQFAEYDEENRAIHEISKNREIEFKKRRPMVHQISDLSEESKDVGWTDRDILRNKIFQKAEAEAEPESYPSEEGLTGSITNTNQETLSTGSSGHLRQKGVLEEIDDDQFFLRKRGISQDNIEIRQYISTAIREGFDTPLNALAQLGDSQGIYPEMDSTGQMNYGYDVPPPKPRRAKYKYDQNTDSAEVSQEFDIERKENYEDDISLPQTGSDYFKHLPPSRPLRKSKKQYSEDSQDVPDSDLPYFDDDDRLFYKREENNNLDIPDITRTFHPSADYDDEDKTETPPKAPKRRKKQIRESVENDSFVNGFGGRSISNSFLENDNQVEELVVYRTEHEYIIPLAQAENFATPTPPTRSRSRSRVTDDDRTSREADSIVLDMQQEDERFFIEMKENDGYAIVRKEPPPRPPPPMRRKRSPNFLDEKFSTMPHLKSEEPPERPKRNYSTIGPSRPPRRKSSTNLGETPLNGQSADVTEYEELDVEDTDRPESPRNLISGDVINKMKYRPLPPPPRPPRENRRHKGEDDKYDKDGGGERIMSDIQQNGNYEIEKSVEKCIEVEVSTQTDPLPDDFVCEEFEITEDMKVIEPRRSKTLEDILKEEQEAEMERARQLVEEDNLTRSIQKFRDAGQRSYSERSRGSTAERSRTQSRPNTPSAIVIEKRVPTPIPNKVNETMLTASLIVQPIDDFDMEDELVREYPSEEKLEEQVSKSDVSSQKQEEEERLTIDYSSDQRSMTSEQRVPDQEIHESPVRERSYQENQAIDEPVLSSEQNEEQGLISESEELPPQPPPRKRSSVPTVEPSNQVESVLSVVSEQTPTQITTPNRLALADLDVERLNVHALQAGRIMVSQLQGAQISADELECKSGNLVVRNMEFPPGFIEQIIERVRNTEIEHSQAQTQTADTGDVRLTAATQEEAPARPPPPQQPGLPSEYMQYSIPPSSFFELRNPTDEEHPHNLQVHRRRRHHRRRDSSSDEDSYRERRRSRQGTLSPEPTIGQLGGQLLRLCGSSVLRTMNQIVNYLQTTQKEGNERSISTAIVLLILMAFGFLILGLSGKNIHHHHWDFFNPPGNEGRGQ